MSESVVVVGLVILVCGISLSSGYVHSDDSCHFSEKVLAQRCLVVMQGGHGGPEVGGG